MRRFRQQVVEAPLKTYEQVVEQERQRKQMQRLHDAFVIYGPGGERYSAMPATGIQIEGTCVDVTEREV